MYYYILVILTELRTGGGAFLVIQCFCKKWEKTINNTDTVPSTNIGTLDKYEQRRLWK